MSIFFSVEPSPGKEPLCMLFHVEPTGGVVDCMRGELGKDGNEMK